MNTESHPFEPWMPGNARLLMCGTFPPASSRWSMPFYYPNYINDMWRIFGLLLHDDRDWYVDTAAKTFRLELIKQMLTHLGLALSDTGREVIRTRGNASDKYLEIVRPLDLSAMLAELPLCHDVATTGEKAAGIIAEITGTQIPKVGEYVEAIVPGCDRRIRHWRMPSTSRAYPLNIVKKAGHYGRMLRAIYPEETLLSAP